MQLTRRGALLGLTAAVTLGGSSLAWAAAATDKRFVVVLLRGALDGMAAVVPYGDPGLIALRGALLPPPVGAEGGLLDLGGFYGMHPALAGAHALYAANELLVVHAVAGDWRSRSHFEAQDFLESGADNRLTSGWLNRVAAPLPNAGGMEAALAIGATVPLLLRGPARVGNWEPAGAHRPDAGVYARLAAMYGHDPLTGPAIMAGLRDRGFSEQVLGGQAEAAPPGNRGSFPALATAAGRLLAAADGPRLAALEVGGWDTHADQLGRLGSASSPLRQLGDGLAALKDAMGSAWADTAVLVITEFGRTARINGTKGTDHGTGTVAFVAGGAVAGGRVRADWPGLAPGKLFEARDLAPTTDLRAVAKGVLASHLGLGHAALAQVFPGSVAATPTAGLVRTA